MLKRRVRTSKSIFNCSQIDLYLVLGYRLDDLGFESLQGLGIFLFTTMSILALGPTQPPIQWVPGGKASVM